MTRKRVRGYFQYFSVPLAEAAQDWLANTWAPAHNGIGQSSVGPLDPDTEEGCATDAQVNLDYVYTDNTPDDEPRVEIYTAIGEEGTVATAGCANSMGGGWESDD